MSEFTIINSVLNTHHTMDIARSLYKLMSTYFRDRRIQNLVSQEIETP